MKLSAGCQALTGAMLEVDFNLGFPKLRRLRLLEARIGRSKALSHALFG